MNGLNWTRTGRIAPTLLGLALLAACGGGEPAEDMVEEAVEAPAAPAMPDAPVVEGAELGTNTAAFEGQMVRVNGLRVTGPVGSTGVWVELPTTPQPTPLLVRGTPQPAAGSTIDVVGTVQPISSELVSGWVSAGEITENEQIAVEFATHYLDAQAIETAGGM